MRLDFSASMASLLWVVMLVGCTQTRGVVDVLAPSGNLGSEDATVIQCKFGSLMNVTPEQKDDGSEEIRYEVSRENEPLQLTIVKHEQRRATLKSNGGESELIVVKDDEEGMVFLEQSGFGYVFTYTIFPDRDIGIWTKTNEAFGSIYSFVGVGRCW